MFTAKPQKNRAAATQYFDEHLSQNDYYTLGESQAGQWIGEGAKRLGLKNDTAVSRGAFLRLCDNEHPETGLKLTPLRLSERRLFFDFTCSAPKSVSILAVTMDDRRIIAAHREAASVALRELEAFASARVRKDGAMDDRPTGNVIGAAFLHTSSRALDPQLHTHFTLFNATFDPVESRWKALQTSRMFEAIRYGTAVYRNELSKRLHGLGYGTRQTAHGFEIAGVEPRIIERFSKRSQQRNAAVVREEIRLGRKLTNDEVSHLVHQSRPRKRTNASDAEVRAAQLDEIGFFEKRALRKLIAEASGARRDFGEHVHLGQASDYAIEHVFARQSVAPEHQLLEAALVKARGQLDVPELKRTLGTYRELVKAGREYSTRTILKAELSLIQTVNDGLDAVLPMAPRFEVSPKLGTDQRTALALVLSSPDRITGIQGLAGTGKTTALHELQKAVVASGYELRFCAPSAAATDVLRKEGFSNVVTVAGFLTDPAPLSQRCVLVIDEAGTLGTVDMLKVFHAAKHARVVLVGDTGQHAPVTQGDALRIIETHSGYRFGQLTQIRRQRSAELKATVALAAKQQTRAAFQRLRKAGELVEHGDTAVLYQKAADAYLEATQQGKTALLVSPTWAEIETVTEIVRAKRREQKQLAAEEEIVSVFDPLGWTDAQKRLVDHYEPGVQLRFVKATAQFKAGESVDVVGHVGRQLRVRGGDDRERTFQLGRAPASFEVGQKRELGVAAGDLLLLRANAPGFVNGERVAVKCIHQGAITLDDGRTLPRDYRTFAHGYALTSHAAQGKTVDEVLVIASSRSFAAVSQEQFYVSISRARERARIYTDDAGLLGRRVEDTHTRKAAVELEGLHSLLAAHGFVKRPMSETRREAEHVDHGRAVRPTRAVHALRTLRTEAIQRLTRIVEDFRRWVGQRVGTQRVDLSPRVIHEQTQHQRVSAHLQQQQHVESRRQSHGHRI